MEILFILSSPEDMLTYLRERGREKERGWYINEREKHRLVASRRQVRNIDQLPPILSPSGDWTLSLCMCSDWKLNLWPSGLWDNAPTNWATLARAGYRNSYALLERMHLATKFMPIGWCYNSRNSSEPIPKKLFMNVIMRHARRYPLQCYFVEVGNWKQSEYCR